MVQKTPLIQPRKDIQTVTSEGKSVKKRIEGVVLRSAVTLPDERGTICEIYNPAWGVHPEDLVYVYEVTIRPTYVKGWVVHELQDDRIFVSYGTLRFVLFDNRPDSPTYKLINDFTIGEHNRALITIPKGVFHAVQNVDIKDSMFVNMPTRPYDHANPDKRRLPLVNDLIPFSFERQIGGE